MNYKLIFYNLILSICTLNARVYNVDKFGTTIPEIYIIKNNKNKIESFIETKQSSKAIDALKLMDLCKAIKRSKNKEKHTDKMVANSNQVDNHFIVAEVANDVITNIDVLNAIKFIFFASGYKYDKACAKLMVSSVLDSLIEDKIRQKLAALQEMVIDDSIINEKIEDIAKSNKMTIEQLGKAFETASINMDIFKKNLKSKMIFTAFYQSMAQSIKVSNNTLQRFKTQLKQEVRERRYKLSEIFLKFDDIENKTKVKEKAEVIIKLLKRGLSFKVLSENISQSTNNRIGEDQWIKESSLELPVKNAIRNLKVKEFSNIIKVGNGYKIICVIDKAEPNQSGEAQTIYKVQTANISTDVARQQMPELNKKLELLSEANSIEQFNRVCRVYNIKTEEKAINDPNIYELELIKRNKISGKTGLLRIAENAPIIALFVVSEIRPKATIPEDKELNEMIINKKALQEFSRIMKRLRTTYYVKIYKNKLPKIVN